MRGLRVDERRRLHLSEIRPRYRLAVGEAELMVVMNIGCAKCRQELFLLQIRSNRRSRAEKIEGGRHLLEVFLSPAKGQPQSVIEIKLDLPVKSFERIICHVAISRTRKLPNNETFLSDVTWAKYFFKGYAQQFVIVCQRAVESESESSNLGVALFL